MDFYNKIALVSLLSLPIIILIYMLKQKNKEVRVSSLYIWNMATNENIKSASIKRVYKNIFLILQLIICALLALAMARPYIITNSTTAEYVLAIDSSMSMQAEDVNGKGSRFEKAKALAEEMVDNATPESMFTVINVGKTPEVVVAETADKAEVRTAIDAIEVSEGKGDFELAGDIISTLLENKNVYLFSDTPMDIDGINNVIVGGNAENTAITRLNSSADALSVKAFVKVKNYGENAVTRTVSLYADGVLAESKDVSIKPRESADVVFTDIDKNTLNLMAMLNQEDCLSADDYRYAVVNRASEKKVLLCGDENYFLESALSTMSDIKVYKSTGDNEKLSGYDMYVFNNYMPENLPTDGQMLIFNPTESALLNVGEEVEVSNIRAGKSELLNMLGDIGFDVLKAKSLEMPSWGSEVLFSDETPIIIAGEKDNSRIVVCGFDLKNTDLPLKKDFPILIYNICGWFMPESVVEGEITVGDEVELALSPKAESVEVTNAQNETKTVAPPFPAGGYIADGGKGIYTVTQKMAEGNIYNSFAVNVAENEESNLLRGNLSSYINDEVLNDIALNKDLKNIIIIIAMVIMLVEFALYIRSIKKAPKAVIMWLRGVVFIFLILALCDVALPMKSNSTLTVFAVDNSQSMAENIDGIEGFINSAVGEKNENDYVALLSFGENAVVEARADNNDKNYRLSNKVNKEFTDIEKAINSAGSLLKTGFNKRIVLMTDGNENIGDGLSAIKRLGTDVDVCVVRYENDISKEVQINYIDVPKYVKKGTSFDIEISIESIADTSTRLRVYKGNSAIYNEYLNVQEGENSFVINDVADGSGGVVYRAELEPDEDTITKNNSAGAYVYVTDVPRILIIEKDGSGQTLKSILESTNASVETIESMSVSTDIEKLSGYDAIVLADCDVEGMPEGMPEALLSYVKNSGGGLLVTGGENSFALGGYKDTALEKILPVSMELSDKDKDEDLGMVIVLDRSGSMSEAEYGVSKLELAKEAVVRSVENLKDSDSVGVIAFDDGFSWTVGLERVGGNIENIKNDVLGITDGGGTSIYPALEAGYNALAGYDCKLKHIILLTDGQSDSGDFRGLINSMKEKGITLSTVAVGENSDVELLQNFAQLSGGRYYYTDVFSDLPSIFEKETFLASKEFLNNIDFYPTVVNGGEILKDIGSIPMLNGYIATTAKPSATVNLQYDENTPIIASWQYGLGKTAVFTGDIENWSSDFLATIEGVSIIRNSVAYVERTKAESNADVSVEDNEILLSFDSDVEAENIEGNIVGNDFYADISFERISNNEFMADAKKLPQGSYVLNLTVKNGEADSLLTMGLNVPYSREYDIRYKGDGVRFNDSIVKNGGREIGDYKDVFKDISLNAREKINISYLFLIAGILLLVLEIALRRLNIKFNKPVKKAKTAVVEVPKPDIIAEVKGENEKRSTTAKLLENKRNREK